MLLVLLRLARPIKLLLAGFVETADGKAPQSGSTRLAIAKLAATIDRALGAATPLVQPEALSADHCTSFSVPAFPLDRVKRARGRPN